MRTRSTKRATRATSTAEPPFRVERKSRNIHVVHMDIGSMKDERWFLLSSDRHHDNPHSDHELELKHLREAKKRGAGIGTQALAIGYAATDGQHVLRSAAHFHTNRIARNIRPEGFGFQRLGDHPAQLGLGRGQGHGGG